MSNPPDNKSERKMRIHNLLGKIMILASTCFGAVLHAQELPKHSASFSILNNSCEITFEPDEMLGNHPPQLLIKRLYFTDRFDVLLTGFTFTEQTFVSGGERAQFATLLDLTVEQLTQSPLWVNLELANVNGEPSFFTTRDPSGAYSSSRYENLTPDQISRTISLACQFSGFDQPILSDLEALNNEKQLRLSNSEINQIRSSLFNLYAEPGSTPGTSTDFTSTDRRFIALFNSDEGYDEREFLAQAAVDKLLRTSTRAIAPRIEGNLKLTSTFDDWNVYTNSDGNICQISTISQTDTSTESTAEYRMNFSVSRNDTGGMMAIEILSPNPFRVDDAITATIGGISIPLITEPSSGAVVPRPLTDGRVSNELTRRLRLGREIIIQGTRSDTSESLQTSFSAVGFTAAFRKMANDCNRQGTLGWLD